MTMCTYFGTLRLIIILLTSICLQDAQAIRKPFKEIERCPFNESEWKMRASHMTCNGSDSYHCLLTDGEWSLREQCTEASLFISGFCPIFTNEGYLQWFPCKDEACPASSYRSDEVYQYQICYRKTDNSKGENTEQGSNDSNSVIEWTIILVVIVLFCVLVLVVFYKRNQFGFKDKVQLRITYLRNFFQCTDRADTADDNWNPPSLISLQPELPVYARPYKDNPLKDAAHGSSVDPEMNGFPIFETVAEVVLCADTKEVSEIEELKKTIQDTGCKAKMNEIKILEKDKSNTGSMEEYVFILNIPMSERDYLAVNFFGKKLDWFKRISNQVMYIKGFLCITDLDPDSAKNIEDDTSQLLSSVQMMSSENVLMNVKDIDLRKAMHDVEQKTPNVFCFIKTDNNIEVISENYLELQEAKGLLEQMSAEASSGVHRQVHTFDETNQKTEKLKELLTYLVQILKQELSVNELKEKAVIHSKCINEHFSEPLVKDLQSLKDRNDYSRLDMSMVFALLQNFCESIKPPSRGWDYEPPDDETHTGADIERIRYMWNKYCDDDLQFKHLDDIYNRMKQKYGTVAVHRDDGVRNPPSKDRKNIGDLKDKIQSIKMNEDCIVKKGIVITENITRALKTLQSKNVVILKGAIGCGKTHALKAIQNQFQKTDWETEWVESEKFRGKISYGKPTILLCDNFFGKFGTSVFSQDAVNKTEQVLGEIYNSIGQTKVIIGIHTHVYDDVKKNFKLNCIHQKSITIEMDNLSEAETLLIFKEQLKKGHCKNDPDCWFKGVGFQSVLDKLSKNQGQVGGPFLSLMYCNQHELFSDEAFSVNPVKTLVQHFQRMKRDSPKIYYCFVYLMCVQQHNFEEEPKKWAGHISVEITKHNLMDLAKASGLLQVENTVDILAHELLTTVLFKSASETIEIFLPVLQICDIDVFLQLLRPTNNTHCDLYFEYMCKYDVSSIVRDVGKMCAYRLAGNSKKQKIKHPLMAIEVVKYKYLEYLIREPKTLYLISV